MDEQKKFAFIALFLNSLGKEEKVIIAILVPFVKVIYNPRKNPFICLHKVTVRLF